MEIPTEMINILLCDDERKITNQLAKYINTFYKSLNKEYTITICHSGLELNKLIDQRLKMDVIFLDIELKEHDKNGVWAAKMTKQKNPESIIIFTTNHEEYIDDVIEKYAFRYWSKPIDEYRLKKEYASYS